MTTQIPDYIKFKNEEYRVIGINGQGLLSMQDFDVTLTAVMDCCWRGYYMGYSVTNKQLIATLLVVMGRVERTIDGIEARPVSNCEPQWCATEWRGLNRPTPFSGKLLIGRHLLRSMYVPSGFQKPAAYRYVHELTVDEGQLQNSCDVSNHMALLREKISYAAYQNKALVESVNEIHTWKHYKLSLNYDAWWWN